MPCQVVRVDVDPVTTVAQYDPGWRRTFAQLGSTLLLAIEHVGSTAVEGLAATRVIDIDVVDEGFIGSGTRSAG